MVGKIVHLRQSYQFGPHKIAMYPSAATTSRSARRGSGGSWVLRTYDRCDQTSAIRFVDYVLEKLPFRVEVIQTDNGAEFQSRFHALDAGIGHVTSSQYPFG